MINKTKYTRGLRMSFTFLALSFLLAVTGVAALANAQENESTEPEAEASTAATTSTRERLQQQAELRREAIEEKRASSTAAAEERVEDLKENVEERRATLSERRQDRIRNLAANMANRMEAAIARLENISMRLDARIELLGEQGVDPTEALAKLEEANQSLEKATLLLTDIDALVFDAATSESPKEMWVGTRQTFLDVKAEIRSAYAALRSSLSSLKQAVANADSSTGVSEAVRATTSTSTTEAPSELSE